jgi:hypothetical protein
VSLKSLALVGFGMLAGCGDASSITVDSARFAIETTLNDTAATNVTLGGDADNYVSVTLLDSAINTGKVYSKRRSQAQVSVVSVDWAGRHYVESLKHDTWSRVEFTKENGELLVSVAGRFVDPTTEKFIDVKWSTVKAPPVK